MTITSKTSADKGARSEEIATEAPETTPAALVYLSRWPPKSDTYKTMRGALDTIVRVLDPDADHTTYAFHELRRETVRPIAAKLRESGLAVNTVNKCLSALRGVLEEASQAGEIPAAEYQRIGKIKNLSGGGRAAGHALSDRDAEALEAASRAVSARDAALIAVLYACGLRRVEAVRLVREDYDPHRGEIHAQGKGDKPRVVPVQAEWRTILEAHWRAVAPREKLFSSSRRKSLSRSGVSQIIERFCLVVNESGGRRFTPHDLRRTFATRVIEESDLAVAQHLLGHVSLDTTEIYDRRGDAPRVAAVGRAMKFGRKTPGDGRK